MAGLEQLVHSGKTRYIGVCNFSGAQIRECAGLLHGAALTALQVGLNLFDQRWLGDAFPTCQALRMGVMTYGSLAHGLLTGRMTRENVFGHWKRGTAFGQALMTQENMDHNLAIVARLSAIAKRLNLPLPHLALAWVLAHPPVAVALVGARTPEEVQEVAAASTVRLSPEVMREMGDIVRDAAGLSTVLPTF